MREDPDVEQVAAALRLSIGLLRRRLRQAPVPGELTMPESSALARLDRGGPATASALARQEQISPQSMGATLAALAARGLVERRPDPQDGRRAVMSVTEAGRRLLHSRRSARTQQLARALSDGFTPAELRDADGGRPAARAAGAEHLMAGCRDGRAEPDRRRPLPVGGPGQHDRRHVHGRARRVDRHHRAARPSSAASTWTRWRRATSPTCCG